MRRACALLLLATCGCGSELTDLIPARLCSDWGTYPGGGLHAPDATLAPLTLNGDAAIVDGVLRVTPALKNALGSAYFSEPLALATDTSLSVRFSFRIGGGGGLDGADGMALVLQSSPTGPNALGLDGGGLGYQNITPSIALELDPYVNIPDPPAGGHIALMLDGDINVGLQTFAYPPFVLNDGVTRHLWLDYAAAESTLRVYVSDTAEKPRDALLTQPALSLYERLGPTAYVGFSASAGERFNDHDVLGEVWAVTDPEAPCD
jgi:hypothetical protein